MRLFNYFFLDIGHHIYIEQKRRGREQDSGETEREYVCERWRVVEGGGSIGCKMGRWRKHNG
jgi:hypothetical protein